MCRYFSSLILVEGMDIDFLHKCALEDRTEEHQFANTPAVCKVRVIVCTLRSKIGLREKLGPRLMFFSSCS